MNTIIDGPKKSGGEKSTVKKTSTMAKNSTSEELTKVTSSKKHVEGDAGEKTSSEKDPKKNMRKESSPLKKHKAIKEPVKNKHAKQKTQQRQQTPLPRKSKDRSLKETKRAKT